MLIPSHFVTLELSADEGKSAGTPGLFSCIILFIEFAILYFLRVTQFFCFVFETFFKIQFLSMWTYTRHTHICKVNMYADYAIMLFFLLKRKKVKQTKQRTKIVCLFFSPNF